MAHKKCLGCPGSHEVGSVGTVAIGTLGIVCVAQLPPKGAYHRKLVDRLAMADQSQLVLSGDQVEPRLEGLLKGLMEEATRRRTELQRERPVQYTPPPQPAA